MQRTSETAARSVMAGLLGLLAAAGTALGTTIGGTEFDLEYWAGTGANQAVMVVDFAATGGQSYSFGFQWDGTATGYDMVQAVAGAGALDFAATTFPGFGTYIDNFLYGSEAGNVSYYWQYFTGTPTGGTVAWTSSMIGMSDRILSDGSIDGWYNGFNPGASPRAPEPATALFLAAGVLLSRKAIRRPRGA